MASLTAHVSETRNGSPCVELRDGDLIVAKMYASPTGGKIRVVFSELVNFKQTKIFPDAHFVEFTRDKKGGLP